MSPVVRPLISLVLACAVFAAAVAATFVVTGYYEVSRKGRAVHLYIWSAYLAPDTLRLFTDSTGITVHHDLYDSNEALLAKLQAGNAGYDVVVPSDYMVEILIRQGLLEPIDATRVPGLAHVDPQFKGLPHDPEWRYSVPFVWGTTAIGYRKDKVKKPVDSWWILWDPEYRNRITMLDDVRETMGAALKSLGYKLNCEDPRQLVQARDLLVRQKPLIKEYNSSNFQDLLISGEAWIVHGFNGQIARAVRECPTIGYAIPKEGATRSIDSLCIPRDAPHKAEALALIQYLLEPKVAASLCMYTWYSTCNRSARSHLPPELVANPVVFPSEAALKPCEYIRDVGPLVTTYDRYWTEIKSR